MSSIQWNPDIKLIISDVDETIADLFVPATPEMVIQLNSLLTEGKVLFLVTGAGFASVKRRITDLIRPELRKKILVSHCSGAEVRGFTADGNVAEIAHYSLYDQTLNQQQKEKWREIVKLIINEFHLETHPTMPLKQFKAEFGDNPLAVMLEDRGPQITFEFINAYNLTTAQIEQLRNHVPNFDISDFRFPVMERFQQLFNEASIPVTPRFGGTFALDLALKGVSKTTSVKFILDNEDLLKNLSLNKEELNNPSQIEIWGDKYSVINGGTDRHMSEALPKEVRSIDFRQENAAEFMEGYNIVLWDGEKQLHYGLLEYLQSRNI